MLGIFGKKNNFSLEHKIVNIALFMAILLSIQSGLGNYFLQLDKITIFIPAFSFFWFSGALLYSVIKKKYLGITIATYIYLLVIFTPVLWITNSGTLGGFQYYTFLFTLLIVGVLHGKIRWVVLGILVIVTISLIVFEFYNPDQIINYPTRKDRFIDIIISYVIVFIALALLITAFINQYLDANKKLEDNNQLLEKRNIEITAQREEISRQKEQIEKSHQHIKDSINYAKRIQEAMLPNSEFLKDFFADYFVLFLPKETVSGDFYFIKQIGEILVVAVADSTGHGVPGAFVSMLGISSLNEIVSDKQIKSASCVLEKLRQRVKSSLKQETIFSNSDGMDIALCAINTTTKAMQFSGANNPAYVVSNDKLKVLEPVKNPIGIFIDEKPFKDVDLKLHKNDVIYLFSDGYADQLSSKKENKFFLKNFKNLLLEIHKLPMEAQKQALLQAHLEHRKNAQQTDDILVVGLLV